MDARDSSKGLLTHSVRINALVDNREYSFTSIMIEPEKSILQVTCGARGRCTLISAIGFGFYGIEWTVLRVLLLLQMTSLTALVFTVAAEERRRRQGHTVERNSKLEQLLACCLLVDAGIMSLNIPRVSRSEAFTDYFSACFLLCTPVSTLFFTRTVLTVMITLISLLSNWSEALTCISNACDSIFALSLTHAKL